MAAYSCGNASGSWTSPDVCQRSIQLGFSSVMMDGSLGADVSRHQTSYDYNVDVTRRVVAMAMHVVFQLKVIGCLGSLETGMAGEGMVLAQKA